MDNADNNISLKPYKGVRDFYPDQVERHEYLLDILKQVAREFGYRQIKASVLERAQLYDAKSGSELARKQAYRFEDKSGREVMLRPEMTPTTARMLASKYKSLSFPVRWFSLPNVFRYEKPQHGRLREHWQLNADIFGIESQLADGEIIELAAATLQAFGATESDYDIKVNSRSVFDTFCAEVLEVDSNTQNDLTTLVDKRDKMDADAFADAVADLLDTAQVNDVQQYLQIHDLEDLADTFAPLTDSAENLKEILANVESRDVSNAAFRPGLVRGLDYYTGMVFEAFDTHEDNPRALCGGGRYDRLMEIFDVQQIPAVGFGLGDVTLADFLDTHKLWPEFVSMLDVVVVLVDRDQHTKYGNEVAQRLRSTGLNVAVDISDKAVGTQIKQADQAGADEVVIVGDEEVEDGTVTIKTLETGDEVTKELTAAAL